MPREVGEAPGIPGGTHDTKWHTTGTHACMFDRAMEHVHTGCMLTVARCKARLFSRG